MLSVKVYVFAILATLFWAFLGFALHHGVEVWGRIFDNMRALGEEFGDIWAVVDEVEGGFICLGEILGGHSLLVGYESLN